MTKKQNNGLEHKSNSRTIISTLALIKIEYRILNTELRMSKLLSHSDFKLSLFLVKTSCSSPTYLPPFFMTGPLQTPNEIRGGPELLASPRGF